MIAHSNYRLYFKVQFSHYSVNLKIFLDCCPEIVFDSISFKYYKNTFFLILCYESCSSTHMVGVKKMKNSQWSCDFTRARFILELLQFRSSTLQPRNQREILYQKHDPVKNSWISSSRLFYGFA